MKLLAKSDAHARLKKDNEELVGVNIRLRKFAKDITQKLNTIKDSYEPDKIQRLKEFEQFCLDLNQKRSALLQELSELEKSIELRKDVYYGLIEKQDQLEERIYQANEREAKLDLRESFVTTLEQEWKNKTQTIQC